MSATSPIEWTDATWNPWHGCHKITPGCKNCYMFREKKQYGQNPNLVVRSKTLFGAPLKWKEPKLVFTCSWSDWFIEEADAWRDEAWDIIRRTPQHTYQILTKRPDRMEGRVPDPPLPNVWLGVSVENQQYADERIPPLLKTPAAIRFLSVEPLLGPVTFRWAPWADYTRVPGRSIGHLDGLRGIDWVIVGGESGPGARPLDMQWVRSIVEQCRAARVPCFVKQMGAYPCQSGMGKPGGAKQTWIYKLKSRKGGDPDEWPPDLRVREMPEGADAHVEVHR